MNFVMALFDSQFLTRLRRLELVARRLETGLAAPPATRLPAGGTQLTGHRDYTPGDDLRKVDWTVCARHDELVVRQYEGEADPHLYVLLDGSSSMAAGTPAKFDVARQAAAALAYVALKHLVRVRIVVFSDRIDQQSAPFRGEVQIVRLLRFLESLSTHQSPTDLAETARGLVGRHERHGPAAVVSDFFDPAGVEPAMDVLRLRGYSPRIVQIYDETEANPDVLGDQELHDDEARCRWQLTVTERHTRRYRQLFEEHQRGIRRYAAKYRLGCSQIRTDLPLDQVLLAAIGVGGRHHAVESTAGM
jgi:uncharacterized protein (DUF58 family)